MRTPRIIGVLSLFGVLLAAGSTGAAPVFSDRIVITDAAGKTILDVTRNESEPNRTCERSRVSNEASGRALTSIETGAVTEYSSGLYFGGVCTAVCARSGPACTRK